MISYFLTFIISLTTIFSIISRNNQIYQTGLIKDLKEEISNYQITKENLEESLNNIKKLQEEKRNLEETLEEITEEKEKLELTNKKLKVKLKSCETSLKENELKIAKYQELWNKKREDEENELERTPKAPKLKLERSKSN